MDDCRRQAETAMRSPKSKFYHWGATVIIVGIWFWIGYFAGFMAEEFESLESMTTNKK